MIANLGYGALVVTLLVSLYGIGAAFYGAYSKKAAWVDSARNAMLLTFPLVTLAALCIITLLVNGNYEVEYVASVTSNSMPTYLKITALWGGQAGSLVFWTWLMSAFASAVTLRKWERDREFLPWVIIVCLVTLVFFLVMIIFFENPFARIWQPPLGQPLKAMFPPAGAELLVQADGRGLNPLLRHPGMIIHPPMLYLGFVSFVIPYAFAIAALITGRTDDRWIRITRRWTLVAWLFLSLGLVLGGRWAYDVLGWGGYWGWDPVEIAAFMPWLTGTAFLHSVMIQEKRGMLKHWNMVLIILTYDLVIFGTFLTRSGVLSSVHAFAQSAIGPLFFVFIGLTFIVSVALLLKRWGELKSEGEMTSMFSREALFTAQQPALHPDLVCVLLGGDLPPDLGDCHRAKSDLWTRMVRAHHRTAVCRIVAPDGRGASLRLEILNRQDPGKSSLEALPGFTGGAGNRGDHRNAPALCNIGVVVVRFCGFCNLVRILARRHGAAADEEREPVHGAVAAGGA